ncbi:MAG: PTS sugar transporter subunit IIA [Phycisphaerales bacterium]
MQLEGYLDQARTLVLSGVADRDELLRRLAEASQPALPGRTVEELVAALQERETSMPTSTPEGVGFPHAMLPGLEETVVTPARLIPGVAMGAPDHPPVDIVFCMFGSSDRAWDHVRLLARLARIARGPGALEHLRGAKTSEAFFTALVEEDRSHG